MKMAFVASMIALLLSLSLLRHYSCDGFVLRPPSSSPFVPFARQQQHLRRHCLTKVTRRPRQRGASNVLVVLHASTPTTKTTGTPSPSSSSSSSSFEGEDYESYSRCLSPREELTEVVQETEQYAIVDRLPRWQRVMIKPFRAAGKSIARRRRRRKADKSAAGKKHHHQKPGALILLLTGESTWLKNHTFTGWKDPDLTDKGILSCQHSARLLMAEGYEPDVVYTSRLKRAIKSAFCVLQELGALHLPMYKSYRLNARMYGSVEGLCKDRTARELGGSVVQAWRSSLKALPPPVLEGGMQQHDYRNDRRYADLHPDQIPRTESILDCQERARPMWEYRIKKDLEAGNHVLVVAHRDSIRGLIKTIDGLSDDLIQDVTVPRGVPLVYRFDDDMKPIRQDMDDDVDGDLMRPKHASATFLEKPGLLEKAMEKQIAWQNFFAGGNFVNGGAARESTLEHALMQLRREQNVDDDDLDHHYRRAVADDTPDVEAAVAAAAAAAVYNETEQAAGEEAEAPAATTSEMTATATTTTAPPSPTPPAFLERWSDDDPSDFEEWDFASSDDLGGESQPNWTPNIVPLEETSSSASTASTTASAQDDDENTKPKNGASFLEPIRNKKEPVVVFVRHGRTPHNNLGLFTGWEDPKLAAEGEEDAKAAGRLLKRHGFEFDVVYTSWLTRAIQTACFILDELDSIWVPVIKSWRLNERMYGTLTGKSKSMVKNEYGNDQLVKWRRGYKIRPPAVSSFSQNYPGNDIKRTKHVKDLPISITESLARSLEQRRLVVHRKFPKTESLKDCMRRSIPFYTDRICKEAEGKQVLISSHENAIRGILMHLCDIPEDAMNQLHLPNGLPLVYHTKGRCITLLDDGTGRDPMEVHDFGPAAKYLFTPCQLTDEFYDEMEKQKQAA